MDTANTKETTVNNIDHAPMRWNPNLTAMQGGRLYDRAFEDAWEEGENEGIVGWYPATRIDQASPKGDVDIQWAPLEFGDYGCVTAARCRATWTDRNGETEIFDRVYEEQGPDTAWITWDEYAAGERP